MSHFDPGKQCMSQAPPVHETSHVEPAWHSVTQFPPVHEIEQLVLFEHVVSQFPPVHETSHELPEAQSPPPSTPGFVATPQS